MATFKHISSKNADYGAAEQYLTFEHDEFTMKPTLDENGRLIPRDDYRISSLNCGDEDFAIACMRTNLKYGKNQKRERLYEDSVTGRISDERFTELSADYEAEQKELKEKAAALQSELSKTLEATANAEKFMKVVRKYTSFEELTPTLLREFVEKIVIHESEALDGKRRGKLRRQEIEIYYSFVGKVELPD